MNTSRASLSKPSPSHFMEKNIFFVIAFFSILFLFSASDSQELDADETLDRLKRLEKNVSDLQKGKFDKIDKNLSSGYISRNESRLDELETKNRLNFGIIEEIQNKINNLNERLEILNTDFQSRLLKIENNTQNMNSDNRLQKTTNKNELDESILREESKTKQIENETSLNNQNEELDEAEIKKKYENAIKLLWASKFDEAENELKNLKKNNPVDLMPNIQYWLGEIHYAQKDFESAIVEFGEGLQRYPDSIKGPDNMLKLALSFSNLDKKNDACNVLYQLQVKYKNAPKNVLERSLIEIKKLDCPKE